MSALPRVGIIGCGLIGNKRARALPKGTVTALADVRLAAAETLASELGSNAPRPQTYSDPVQLCKSDAVDAVLIATSNSSLVPLAEQALSAGKHVLLEKPGALSYRELSTLQPYSDRGLQIRIGYNHRFHPALQKAHSLFTSGACGEPMFIRGRYGHGGRVGYEKEWRANPALSGGGELIDQGVHLIDLAGWFLGEFSDIQGHVSRYFWDMPVDDNAFLNLRTADGKTAFLQASCTEWKNLFSFEIYCRNAKLHVEGLGGSYGVERLYHYQMLPEMGPPPTTIYEFVRGDDSWKLETLEFLHDIAEQRQTSPGLKEGLAALRVVEAIYAKSVLK